MRPALCPRASAAFVKQVTVGHQDRRNRPRRHSVMNRTRTIVVASTLDGIIQDPAGSEGTPAGGWVFRNGPEAVAGDRFKLGSALDSGVLLLGRRTWEQF